MSRQRLSACFTIGIRSQLPAWPQLAHTVMFLAVAYCVPVSKVTTPFWSITGVGVVPGAGAVYGASGRCPALGPVSAGVSNTRDAKSCRLFCQVSHVPPV